MAYKGKQKEVRKFSSEKPDDIYYNFEVRFGFRGEVAPKDRRIIKERIDELFKNKHETYTSFGSLSRNSRRSLGFIISSFFTQHPIPRKYVEAINRYVLTGDKTGIDQLDYF